MASLQLLNSEVGFPIEFLSLSFDSGSKRSASKLGSTALAVESEIELEHSSWPLVGKWGINLYFGILGIHSLIPY